MKSIMLSVQPKWVEKIASGIKTVEVRKTKPKIDTPFKCYIYETKSKDNETYKRYKVERLSSGRIIGEFVCDYIITYVPLSRAGVGYTGYLIPIDNDADCLSGSELLHYGKGKYLYGWHISDLKIYDKPKELGEFRKPCIVEFNSYACRGCKYYQYHLPIFDDKPDLAKSRCADGTRQLTRPPQSWYYIEEN